MKQEYLEIWIENEKFLIPFEKVIEVVNHPIVSFYPKPKENWVGVVYNNGDLMPLLDITQGRVGTVCLIVLGKTEKKIAIAITKIGSVRSMQEEDHIFCF